MTFFGRFPLLGIACTGLLFSAQATAGCDEKNVGVYEYDSYSGTYYLIQESWNYEAQYETKLSGDITIPKSAFDDGGSGGGVFDPLRNTNKPDRGNKPGPNPVIADTRPCLPTNLVTATRPSGGHMHMVVFLPNFFGVLELAGAR